MLVNSGSDVVFLDPPWGGKDYKKEEKLTFNFDGLHLADLCETLLNTSSYSNFYLDTDLHHNALTEQNMTSTKQVLNSSGLSSKQCSSQIKIVALKLPFNYDIDELLGKFKSIEESNKHVTRTYLIERLDLPKRNMILLLTEG